MKKVLKFNLNGKTAFFKRPDVNSYFYFTYGNIHKVALLGMFGAIVGYGGYNQHRYNLDNDKKCNQKYPEFYEKLKSIKIGIEPLNKVGAINKKIQTFNNSVGYASQEKGGNLIVKEQWLENPNWNIYLLLDNEEAENISDYIINNKSVYQPYLGKNDHYANINTPKIIDNVVKVKDIEKLNSLFINNAVEVDIIDDEEEDDLFKYSERLPIGLNENTNMYETEGFVYTNMSIESINSDDVYNIENKNIMFF